MYRILILTPQLPYPAHQGTSLRNLHIIRGLANRYRVSLLSFKETNQSTDAALLGPLSSLCESIEVVNVPTRSQNQRLLQLVTSHRPDVAQRLHSSAFDQALASMLQAEEFDIVQIEGLELASAIEVVRAKSPKSKIVYDAHNAETELQRRALLTDLRNPSRWHGALYSWTQIGRLRRYEAWACREADAVTAVSDADGQILQTMLPLKGHTVSVIPNCIDVEEYREDRPPQRIKKEPEERDRTDRYDLVFSGKMDYRPNVDAVLWFADEVWPRILASKPEASWAIVGQKPHKRLARLQLVQGVALTGWVEDVKPYLHNARVYIMPLRMGSGTRLKLIEAMAAGCAVVSTPIAAEGYPVTHDRELQMAETVQEFVAAVEHLLDHPSECARLGQAAMKFAERYDWRRVIPGFDDVYGRLFP